MKIRLLAVLLTGVLAANIQSATTIDPADAFAYGANIGWMDWRGNSTSGAVLGEFVCSGYIYAANVGWINLGSGVAANDIRYQNNSATDFGVNHLGDGRLRGFAYGANIGWINFEDTGDPRVDLQTGVLSGYAWGANVGWISLSNSFAQVRITHLEPGADTDNDGIPDAWEREQVGNLTTLSRTGDADHDGITDLAEYEADTHPLDPEDNLRITRLTRSLDGASATLSWLSRTSRSYRVLESTNLAESVWRELQPPLTILGSASGESSRQLDTLPLPDSFYRIEVIRPLAR